MVCETFLPLLDEQLPGFVEGLYPPCSLGFGEWYDGRRDVDFVAVSSRRPDERELRRLEGLHEEWGEVPRGGSRGAAPPARHGDEQLAADTATFCELVIEDARRP